MEKAIQKAIEGGYDPNWNIARVNEFSELFNRALLDPKFWQALGKSLGWPKDQARTGEFGKLKGQKYKVRFWLAHWHRFIDHLASGKSPDSFFEELIK